MNRVYILGGARTPLGTLDGNLRDYKEQQLSAQAMKLALELAGFEADELSEIVVGTAKQTSLPSNLARYAMLEARLTDSVPAYTVQRQSASGLQAVANGVWSIKSEMAGAVLSGGCDSMTHIPREVHDARFALNERTRIVFDPIAAQVAGAQPENLTAEAIDDNIASQYGISAEEMSSFVVASAAKAAARTAADYICKMQVRKGKLMERIETDEIYPAPVGIAGPADGAAMLLLASEKAAEGKKPAAELLSLAMSAGRPDGSGLLGIRAVETALKKAGIALEDLSRIEIVEISAGQVLATVQGLGLKTIDKRINPIGGGFATGSPWGASGTVCLVDLIYGLHPGQSGMVLNPAEGGQAMCTIVKAI